MHLFILLAENMCIGHLFGTKVKVMYARVFVHMCTNEASLAIATNNHRWMDRFI